jgi:glucokinase
MRKALAIDIGGTRVKSGFVSTTGEVLSQHAEPTPTSLRAMRAWLSKLDASGVVGIGVGCKGIINPDTTIIESLPGTLHYMEGQCIASLLPSGVRVCADNDARAAMAGEMMWGVARGRRNALMLTLGTGVGGAVLAEGQLLRGAGGVAGHVGHLTVDPDGPPCICGNHGCLETYFSAPAIESAAHASVRRGVATCVTMDSTCQDIFAAAAAGDAVAILVTAQAVRKLGGAIAGLIHLLDPEVIILGGQITEAGAQLLKPLRAEFGWRTRSLLRRTVPVVLPKVKSSIAGAAALVFDKPGTARMFPR